MDPEFSRHMCAVQRPPALLLVEDEVLIRAIVAEYLREEGWTVLEAGDAIEAKRLLAADDATIDFVLTDIHMPGGENGLDLARHVHAHHPSVPVLLASGNTAAISASDLDGEQFIAKPYDLRTLAATIRALRAQDDEPVG